MASYGSPSLGVGSTPHDLESFDEDEQQHYTVHVQPLNRSVSANASYGYSGRGGGGGGSRDGISVDVRPQPHVRHHSTGGDGRGAGGDSGFARGWDGFEKVDVDGPGAGLEFDLVSGSSSGTPVATDGRTSVSASGWGAASGTEGQVYTDSDDGQDSGAGSPRQVGRRLGSRQARGRTPCGDDTVLMASVVVEAARADPGGGGGLAGTTGASSCCSAAACLLVEQLGERAPPRQGRRAAGAGGGVGGCSSSSSRASRTVSPGADAGGGSSSSSRPGKGGEGDTLEQWMSHGAQTVGQGGAGGGARGSTEVGVFAGVDPLSLSLSLPLPGGVYGYPTHGETPTTTLGLPGGGGGGRRSGRSAVGEGEGGGVTRQGQGQESWPLAVHNPVYNQPYSLGL